MKLREVICLLNEDLFYVHVGKKTEKSEHIETNAQGSWQAIKKYFDYEVLEIWREEYGMGILLKQK